MTYHSDDRRGRRSNRPRINAARVWAGGVAAAVVAALIVVVGTMISTNILDIQVISPDGTSVYGSYATVGYAITAAGAALVATLLMYLLLLATPEPTQFFGWIAGLAMVIVTVTPFTQSGDLPEQIATAVINLVIGIAIISLLITIGRNAVEPPDPEPYGYPPSRQQHPGYGRQGYYD